MDTRVFVTISIVLLIFIVMNFHRNRTYTNPTLLNPFVSPKISALCVTRNRVPWLRRSIECFMGQSYSNKELVVVYDTDDVHTKAFLDELQNVPLVLVENSKRQKLGALRNMSVKAANGDLLMQWDDDDYYSNDRMKCMQSHMDECGLALNIRWTVIDLKREKMYISTIYDFEGTMIVSKEVAMKCL